MMTKERAVELVEAQLAKERRENPWRKYGPEVAVLDVSEHALGWLVVWQSVEYIRTRDISHMLVGHGPYLVDRCDGSIHHIPVTTYVTGEWEELYLRRRHGVQPVRPADPVLDAVRATLVAEGTLAATRRLRGCAPRLGLLQARAYVLALADGAEPAQELVELTRAPDPICPPLDIETLTGPLVDQ